LRLIRRRILCGLLELRKLLVLLGWLRLRGLHGCGLRRLLVLLGLRKLFGLRKLLRLIWLLRLLRCLFLRLTPSYPTECAIAASIEPTKEANTLKSRSGPSA